jgi:SH3-like domain-containing protein
MHKMFIMVLCISLIFLGSSAFAGSEKTCTIKAGSNIVQWEGKTLSTVRPDQDTKIFIFERLPGDDDMVQHLNSTSPFSAYDWTGAYLGTVDQSCKGYYVRDEHLKDCVEKEESSLGKRYQRGEAETENGVRPEVGDYVEVNVLPTKLSDGPSKYSSILWEIQERERLYILEKKGKWCQVKDAEGDEGWILCSSVILIKPDQQAAGEYLEVRKYYGNIRIGPNRLYEIICLAAQKERLHAIAKKDRWYHVKDADGVTGWIHESAVKQTTYDLYMMNPKKNFMIDKEKCIKDWSYYYSICELGIKRYKPGDKGRCREDDPTCIESAGYYYYKQFKAQKRSMPEFCKEAAAEDIHYNCRWYIRRAGWPKSIDEERAPMLLSE